MERQRGGAAHGDVFIECAAEIREAAAAWRRRVLTHRAHSLVDIAFAHARLLGVAAAQMLALRGEARRQAGVIPYALALDQACFTQAHAHVKANRGRVFAHDRNFLRKYAQLFLRTHGALAGGLVRPADVGAGAAVLAPGTLTPFCAQVEQRRSAKLHVKESCITVCHNRDCKSRQFHTEKIRIRSADEDDTFQYKCLKCHTVWLQ